MKGYLYYFLIFTVFCVTLIVQDAEAHGGCCSPYKCCYFPKCCSLGPCCTTDNTTIYIVNVWEKVLETSLTDNIKTLRQQLISTSNTLYYQGPALGATMYVAHFLLGFQAQPDALCVLVNLIKKVIAEREGCTEGLIKAIEAFGVLNEQRMNYSRSDILVDIKCTTRPDPNALSSKCQLKKKLFTKIMQIIEAPDSLKEIITKLYLSGNPVEQKLAVVVIALFTEYGVQLYNLLLGTDNYRTDVQYYSCLRPIPKKCCPVRSAEFNKLVDQSLIDNRLIIAKIISGMALKPEDVHVEDEP